MVKVLKVVPAGAVRGGAVVLWSGPQADYLWAGSGGRGTMCWRLGTVVQFMAAASLQSGLILANN